MIRDAASADAALMAVLIVTAFEDHRGKIMPPSSAHDETVEQIRAKLRKGGGLIAYSADVVAGCVVFYPDDGDSRYLYLGRLAVLPLYRQRGVGQALVTGVEAKARASGCAGVSLAVRVALPQNRAFFERLGYVVTAYEKHSGYSEPTFMRMVKTLDSDG